MTSLTPSEATTTRRPPWEQRLDFDALAPEFSKAMEALAHAAEVQADQAELPLALREVVRLRASQINGCAYCVDMHAKDARAAGESEQRLDALTVWREVPYFSDAESAALGLAEAITLCAEGHVPESVWAAACEWFSAGELAALVSLVVAVNAWNHIGITTRSWLPGSYTR
jgi:AhpD family alkylhydroperoxidase